MLHLKGVLLILDLSLAMEQVLFFLNSMHMLKPDLLILGIRWQWKRYIFPDQYA